jgi:hypothetical protein
MTDEDLYRLYREEQRLYREYVEASSEEARYPQRVAKKRDAWITLHRKLRDVLDPDTLRRILQSAIPTEHYEARMAARKAKVKA